MSSDGSEDNKPDAKLYELEKRLDILERRKSFVFGKKEFLLTGVIAALISAVGISFAVEGYQTGMQQNQFQETSLVGGQHVIEPLRNDSVETWMAWHISDQTQPFHVHVVDESNLGQEKLDAISDAVTSKELVEIDDSKLHKGPKGSTSEYYKGWAGAIQEADKSELKYSLPLNLHVHRTDDANGAEIIIRLTDQKNSEGYSAYTHSIVDEENKEILKSFITVYDSSNLSADEISLVVKHEMGHALGLKHSSDPYDLMYPEIQSGQPYISECNLDALVALYQGQSGQTIRCLK